MRGVLNNPIFDGTNRHGRHTTTKITVRGTPETNEQFKIWAGEKKTRPQSAHLLYNALWGPNAAPGVASRLGQMFDAIRGDDAGGGGAAGRAGPAGRAGETVENGGDNANFVYDAYLEHRVQQQVRERTAVMQGHLDEAIERCRVLEAELGAREAVVQRLKQFAPASPDSKSMMDMQFNGFRHRRMGLVKDTIDALIRTQALCEPELFYLYTCGLRSTWFLPRC